MTGALATRKSPLLYWTLAYASLAFGLAIERSAAGQPEHKERDVWFVHATDPHLFVPHPGLQPKEENDAAATEPDPNEIACLEKEGKKRERDALTATKQEELNEKALSEMLKSIASLGDDPPEFLVLTGDLGVDPCDISDGKNQPKTPAPTATGTPQPQTQASNEDKSKKEGKPSAKDCVNGANEKTRRIQIEKTAQVLRESPVKRIYLVAGNNDIAKESASDEAIQYFNLFVKDVQAELVKSKSSVQLHNLTRCYASNEDLATCYADIDKTPYRLIGFPSYSFKNEIKNSPDTAAQTEQFKKFRQLLNEARDAKRKVLIISHTPEIDDPFVLAQDLQAGLTPPEAIDKDTANPRSKWSTWNVNKDVLNGWKDMVALESVVAVFAGHLHDSHKEIYRQPYEWSTMTEHRGAFNKLFLAPPLAVKKQDTSPIQARGFSLVQLKSDRVESRPFWYNSDTHQFAPDRRHKHHERGGGLWGRSCHKLQTAIEWLWNLEKNDTALVRMAVLLIAFLTAFLTVVAIWQIAPASDPFADERKTAPGESKPAQTAANAGADSSPFSNRFGKTVIAGLAGLVAAEVTKTLGNEKPSADSRWYYIVWFILFFFLLLLSLNLWRAVVEALRARVAVVYYPPPRHAAETNKTSNLESGNESSITALWSRFSSWSRYWLIMRPGQWLGSLRVPLITFSDTFVNLIQGKNQTRTLVFEQRIIDQQRTVVRVTETIRTSLNRLIERRVQQARAPKPRRGSTKSQSLAHELERVRVNISVLSRDQTNVFYIARAAGSSHSRFPKRSVSWASVFTGQPVWFQSDYREPPSDLEKIILFQESPIPDEKGPIRLRDYYQPRPQEDYEAFIILPVPSPRRGFGTDYVKGAIHISFRENDDFAAIWNAAEMKPKGDPPRYSTPQRTLEDWCRHDDVRAALTTSIAALGELLRGFNEIIYTNYIESRPD